MRSAIPVSLVPQARGGLLVFWDGLKDAFSRAAALGFDAVEIFPQDASTLDAFVIKSLMAKHKLAVATSRV